MAKIVTDPLPRCSGCGKVFYFLHWWLDSRSRYSSESRSLKERIEAGKRGSCGLEMQAFAAQHVTCPEPHRERAASGMLIVDRRNR